MAGFRSGRYGRLKCQLAPAIGVFKLVPKPGQSVPERVPGEFVNESMIPKSGNRFSKKIMLKRKI
jgi:hypothetical protein